MKMNLLPAREIELKGGQLILDGQEYDQSALVSKRPIKLLIGSAILGAFIILSFTLLLVDYTLLTGQGTTNAAWNGVSSFLRLPLLTIHVSPLLVVEAILVALVVRNLFRLRYQLPDGRELIISFKSLRQRGEFAGKLKEAGVQGALVADVRAPASSIPEVSLFRYLWRRLLLAVLTAIIIICVTSSVKLAVAAAIRPHDYNFHPLGSFFYFSMYRVAFFELPFWIVSFIILYRSLASIEVAAPGVIRKSYLVKDVNVVLVVALGVYLFMIPLFLALSKVIPEALIKSLPF